MRSVAPITKIVPLFLWSAKMPKIYAKCQKFMQKLWNFIFCHLNIVRAVYKLSFKLLVRSVAQITKIVPPFLWFRGGLCYKQRRIRHGEILKFCECQFIVHFHIKLRCTPPVKQTSQKLNHCHRIRICKVKFDASDCWTNFKF